MGCIAEIVYGDIECNGDCEHCHWWDKDGEANETKEGHTECCGNCFFFDGDITDTQPQFCDEKEEYVNPGYRCIRYRQRGW